MIVDTPVVAAVDERVSYNVSVNNFGFNHRSIETDKARPWFKSQCIDGAIIFI
jgi:hypothetical protein